MERHADPQWSIDYAPGIVGCTGAFQIAAALWKEGSIRLEGVVQVVSDLVSRGVSLDDLGARLDDLARRAILEPADVEALVARLGPMDLLPPMPTLTPADPAWVAAWERGPKRPWTPARFVEE